VKHYFKACFTAVSLFLLSTVSGAAQNAFSTDCRAFIGFERQFAVDTNQTSTAQRYSWRNSAYNGASLLILPGVGKFMMEHRTNSSYWVRYIDDVALEKILRWQPGNMTDALPAAQGVMARFRCVRDNSYLKNTMADYISQTSTQISASETRVRQALVNTFSFQFAAIDEQLTAIRNQISGLPPSDKKTLEDKLAVVKAQTDLALKQICKAIGGNEAAVCKTEQ